MFFYVYEEYNDFGFHDPNIPFVFWIVLWSYVVLQIISFSKLKSYFCLMWVILNISSLGILLLFLCLFIVDKFYLSYYFVHYHLPVLSINSIILILMNNIFINKEKRKDILGKSDYLLSVFLPILVALIIYIILRFLF